MTLLRNVNVTFQDSLYMSEFAELRVAAPGNRSDAEFIYDKQPLLFDDISSGTGSATHQANGRDLLLAVGGTGDGATGGVREHAWVPYTPGSGQEIDLTGSMDAAGIGGGTASVFLRSKVTGTVTEETIAQGSWLAATSGVDWADSQIFRMSFQSLKVGRIQFALVRGGLPVKVAEITNDNERATGYWQYAGLPPYWKIYNTATNTITEFGYGDDDNAIGFRYTFASVQSTATARAICETVKSQGGVPLLDMPGYPFASPLMTANAVTVSTTLIPVVSIRVAATFNSLTNRTLVIPQSLDIETTSPIDYAVLYRPALTGPSWAAVDATYSGVEYDWTANAVTGGVRVDAGMIGAGTNVRTSATNLLGRVLMSLGMSGTADILTLAAIRSAASNASVKGIWKWKEIR